MRAPTTRRGPAEAYGGIRAALRDLGSLPVQGRLREQSAVNLLTLPPPGQC